MLNVEGDETREARLRWLGRVRRIDSEYLAWRLLRLEVASSLEGEQTGDLCVQ